MKLIYIAHNLSDPVGGAEISSINLVNSLRSSNIHVDCIDYKNIDEFACRPAIYVVSQYELSAFSGKK